MDTISNIIRRLRENRILNEREDYTKKPREELISLAKGGDQLAIETLVHTHKDFLGRMGAKYIMDNWDRDDIEQMVMIAFWEAIQSYNPKTSGDFEAYAGMVIKRRMTDELRKEDAGKRKINTQAKSLDDTSSDSEGNETAFGDTIPDTSSDPEEIYAAKEATEAIKRFMEEKLSEVELEVIKRKIAGDKVSKIAEETGMKYKSVENALKRVKDKLAEFMRNRESKKIEESTDSVEFSEEEKAILKDALSDMSEASSGKSLHSRLSAAYENYTEAQLDRELEDIEEEAAIIAEEMISSYYDERQELKDRLDDLLTKLSAIEEYLTDTQYEECDRLRKKILDTEDLEYEGDRKPEDPYSSRGLSPADFY